MSRDLTVPVCFFVLIGILKCLSLRSGIVSTLSDDFLTAIEFVFGLFFRVWLVAVKIWALVFGAIVLFLLVIGLFAWVVAKFEPTFRR